MAATIKIKNSSTAGAAPTASDLVQGELAVNVTDKRLYTENSGGTIVELGTNPSVPVTFPDGSASAPSLTNSGDTNTGMFFPAADTIAFAEGGTETMRLDSSGNLGLGVTPSAWSAVKAMQVGTAAVYAPTSSQNTTLSANNYYDGSVFKYMTSDYASYYQQFSGQHRWYNAASGTAGNTISFTQAMTLTAAGNLGIGTSSPSSFSTYRYLDLVGGGTSTGGVFQSKTSDGAVTNSLYTTGSAGAIGTSTNHPLQFLTNDTERARIDTSGNLLVGTTTANGKLASAVPDGSTNVFYLERTGGSPATLAVNFANQYTNFNSSVRYQIVAGGSGGVYLGTGATSWAAVSDERLKTTLAPFENAVAKVCGIRSGTGRYFTDDETVSRAFLIAQDVQAVLPEAVDISNDELGTLGLRYTDTIPLLVAAIKELKAEIDALKGQA